MDISRIFSSKTRKELFRLYFTNPDSEYYLRELERILGIPVSMIREELLRLEKEGLFKSHRKANLVYYSLNKSYPLFDELKSIVFKTIGVKGALKQALERIKGFDTASQVNAALMEYGFTTLERVKGIKAAFIYGSFARNEERPTSDIDLFVIGDVDEGELSEAVAHLERILKREINYVLYRESEFRRKKKEKDSFVLDVLRGKKVFIAGSEDDL